MGIYDQPNSWQCGPFALKHGLLAYGMFAHEDALASVAGSTEAFGTDDAQLARTARTYGCVLLLERYRTLFFARRALVRHLAARVPVLLCLDQWDHWVTAVAADDAHVVVLDSHYDTVVRLEPWGPFLRRIAFRERKPRWGWHRTIYDLHPLVARGESGLRLDLTAERARRILDGDPAFRHTWDEYAQRLLPFATKNGARAGAARLDRWLADDRMRVLAQVAERRGRHLEPGTTETLDRLTFAAELFAVRCDPTRASHLIEDIAAMIAGPAAAPAPAVEPRERERAVAVPA